MDLIKIPGAELYYDGHFLPPEEATHWFNTLLVECAWERRRTSFGQIVPRDEAYYGDPGTHYRYSRRDYNPIPWFPELLALKARVEQATPPTAYANSHLPYVGYNAVLCNLYRDGNDSVGLHADAEPEMGPVIASLSLGAERLFRLKQSTGTLAFSERLPHGSLLIMAGTTQKNFQHEIPKEHAITQSRINLTFRHIQHAGNRSASDDE
ncbi:MAG TPA: alpha-ketoglutarate-dependent dioxygenase AlkB [Terriglobales bacterium]|nr:alpha-ketoglutarate-dependent dioxygenase AlkB [Terriglobales bacterium]